MAVDTKRLAGYAHALVANRMAVNLEAAVAEVVRQALADHGGSTPQQEKLWVADVLRVARAAAKDARTLNAGGAGRGQGRIGDVAAAAERLAQMAARPANLEAMSPKQLAAATTSVEAIAAALEGEIARRTR